MTSWIDIGSLEEIPVRGSRVVKTRSGCIAVFRTADDSVFALTDRCPHKGGPLSDGIVHGSSVTCPLHNWVIDLATGDVQGEDTGSTQAFGTQVREGRIYIDLDEVDERKGAACAA